MKKILYLSIILMAAFIVSCDDLLDVTPKTDLSDDNFWRSENDFKGACNRLYEQLPGTGHDARADDKFGKNSDVTDRKSVV